MDRNDIRRITRITAILTQLQTKRIVTAPELARKFEVSTRTIYRDIKTLEQAGVPVLVEEGRGYALMEGFRIPPVMFTEPEANALITAGELVKNNSDRSFIKAYNDAVEKIKAVLRHPAKEKAHLLSERVHFRQYSTNAHSGDHLSALQLALTNYQLIRIDYTSENKQDSSRDIEPFALYHTREHWVLVAYCRLRKEFRAFRLDRIRRLTSLPSYFEPHPITFADYAALCRKKAEHP
ncbi:YafY family transcriptional regulator [Niabella pedocola]|uniref:YafY family transcriptional regulator n=1 Tax=Niabella pedocola TaxID=1752077 RepID=A0ABS8PWZ4_9BACT|nr:YafY family protein [Niabella pedocola]MCD2425602.1 YafY family transcriptional regulator [Niabella pedocola]